MPQWINKDQLKQSRSCGTFLNLNSTTAVEITAGLGFDWLLIDLEHGAGSPADLRGILHACRGSDCAPIVRIPSIAPDTVKFVMDRGAAGIMFPFVSSAEQARAAVASIKYPPMGQRGVAGVIRATNYGKDWKSYFGEANGKSVVVAQIETPEAVAAANEIAATPGVDVLFVGPLDLSVNMGVPGQFDHPDVIAALSSVVDACERNGKSAGILTKDGLLDLHKELGFRMIAMGSDANAVINGMERYLNQLRGSDAETTE